MSDGYWKDVTVEHLENDARAIARLDDFGQPHYRTGLARLLASYAETAQFGPGVADARAALVGVLVQRLRTEAQLARCEDATPPVRPWFILGSPRSGTTALQRMLCADPGTQGLEHWIATAPQPRPPRGDWSSNADYISAVAQLDAFRKHSPRLFEQHPMGAEDADECRLILMQEFATTTFPCNATIPDYENWLLSADMRAGFEHHRAILAMIGTGDRRRWILKDPCHALFLDDLVRVYPDMCVIHTRRPPIELMPSILGLIWESRRLFEPTVSAETVGRSTLALWSEAARRLHRWRAAHPHVPWIDVDQSMLLRDPVGQVRAVFATFGEPLTRAGEDAVDKIATSRLMGGSVRDKAPLEAFGLTADDIDAAFAGSSHDDGMRAPAARESITSLRGGRHPDGAIGGAA